MEKEKRAKCLHCNNDITELKVFVLEQNRYIVELVKGSMTWSVSEVVESSATKTDYKCPDCEETLFTFEGCPMDPPIVVNFLKGEALH